MNTIREHNTIKYPAKMLPTSIVESFYCIEEAIYQRGYSQIVLNFENTNAAFAVGILRLCSFIEHKKQTTETTFTLYFGNNRIIERLFINQNWASIIDPENYASSNYKGHRQVPAIRYSNSSEQQTILNQILDKLLASFDNLKRDDFASIEWALNEIMDNVLVHSESTCGGIVTLQTFNNKNKKIEFVVSDSGIGIPNTLRNSFDEEYTDVDLLLNSVKEGVTNGRGQGNGLFGSLNICQFSNGYFSIDSGGAFLSSNYKNGIHVRPHKVVFPGTTIYASINANIKGVLANALRFKNIQHIPTDYIETKYEMNETPEGCILYQIDPSVVSVGSRLSGNGERNKLYNLIRMSDSEKIIIDFSNVSLISSSFADEFLAKLYYKLGSRWFNEKIEIANINLTIKSIIQKAINQREQE